MASAMSLDEGERQVDAGGHAGGGGDVPVLDEDRVRVDVHGRVLVTQAVAVRPVGGHAPAVEEAGLGEEEGTRADGSDALRLGRAGTDPGDEVLVHAAGPRAAGDDQQAGRVGLVLLPEVAVRDDGQAA
jgi:hypothetical protein